MCRNDYSERLTLGTDFIEDMVSKVRLIQSRIKAAQDRQKRRDDEFNVGVKVFLKVSPTKGVMQFGKKGKLSAKYVGPYEILRCV